MIADAAFVGASDAIVLYSIPCKDLDVPIVHAHRHRHLQLSPWSSQKLADAVLEADVRNRRVEKFLDLLEGAHLRH